MSKNIRTKATGSSLFFTARLADRNSKLLVNNIARLRSSMRLTRMRYPFEITEMVVLPSAIHTIWTLPPDDADFETRWRMFKSQFSRGLWAPETFPSGTNAIRDDNDIWQHRFWEHQLLGPDDIKEHRHMIFSAPVHAGLVERPQDWSFSSVHRAVREGTYDPQTPVDAAYLPFIPAKTRSA